MNTASPHPAPDQLAAYALLLLGKTEAAGIQRHLAGCAACRAWLESLSAGALAALSTTRVPNAVPPGTTAEPCRRPVRVGRSGRSHTPTPGGAATFSHSADTNVHATVGGPVPATLAGHPRYEVLRVLGAGGMGVVYEARHRLMDRPVALKVIRPSLVDHPGMVARFRREVRAAARLAHPNIVAAYDAEQWDRTHFLVMEYIAGADLEQVAAHGRLPIPLACGYARQAALGLQHAFERGMVHRDIKPHNLMVTPEGVVKILDFGLARFASEAAPAAATRVADGGEAGELTPSPAEASDHIPALGTVDYLAPEEAQDARAADIRADIYSLGCTLYRLLAGRVPFPGRTAREKLQAHAEHAPAPLAGLRPDTPAGLMAVLARMMAKRPEDRYQTPAAVAAALSPFAEPRGHRVLVVDDNPGVRAVIRAALERAGHDVAEAADGGAALRLLREGGFGLVLLDLMMPGVDGWEVLRQQRADPALGGVPVVVVSGLDEDEAAVAALGAAAYLRKPFEADELADAVQRHATGASAPAPAEEAGAAAAPSAPRGASEPR